MGFFSRVSRSLSGRDDKPWMAYEGAELAARVLDRFAAHKERLKSSKRHARMLRSWCAYNARGKDGSWDTTEISEGGQAGELTLIKPNEYRNLAQHTLQLATASQPAYDAVAGNTDAESQAQAILGQGLLDYYHHSKGLDELRKRRSETAIVLGESFLLAPWSDNAGAKYLSKPVTQEDGSIVEKPVYEGDFDFYVLTPYDVAYPRCKDPSDPPWLIAFVPVNRYDYAELHPAARKEIMAAPTYAEACEDNEFKDFEKDHDDEIGVFLVWSKPSPAFAGGLDAVVLNDSTVLRTGSLPYKRVPSFRCAPSDVILGSGGYTQFFDVLPLTEAYAAQMSAILSKHSNGAITPMWTPPNSGVSVKDIAPV